jgi:hypothetical protein
MKQTTDINASASFSDGLDTQKSSASWCGNPIVTISPSFESIETYIDVRSAVEAQILYQEQGRDAFVSFDDLRAE